MGGNAMRSRLKDTLLLVGDAASDRKLLREIFSAEYDLLEAETIRQAIALLALNIDCIAAVLAHVPLEQEDSIRELAAAVRSGSEQEVPLLLLIDPCGSCFGTMCRSSMCRAPSVQP
jgi:putative two-component system response regulator